MSKNMLDVDPDIDATDISAIQQWLRSFSSSVDSENKDNFGEVYTPLEITNQMLDQYPLSSFTDITETWLDHCCGSGNLLSEVLLRKIKNGITYEDAVMSLFGLDINPENIQKIIHRLGLGNEKYKEMISNNFPVGDARTYHWRFDGSPPVDIKSNIGRKQYSTTLNNSDMFE